VSGWTINKSIPVSVLVMLMLQFGAFAVWWGKLDSQVNANEAAISRASEDIRSIEAASQERAVVLGRIDERLKRIDQALSRIERNVGR
jgi:Tfp pilus assembly protein PilO